MAIFSLVNAALLRPQRFLEQPRLADISTTVGAVCDRPLLVDFYI